MKKIIVLLLFIMGVVKSENLYLEIEKECNKGNDMSCLTLSTMYLLGGENIDKGIKFSIKGCNLGNNLSCTLLAEHYVFDKDPLNAIKYYLKGCNNDRSYSGMSCSALGQMYYNGEGIDNNYTEAAEYYTKSCKKGRSSTCDTLGDMYLEGKGVNENKEKAKKFFDKACKGGLSRCCSKYKKLKDDFK